MSEPTREASVANANTDRELWRERAGDYYADSIHVTESGGIGINVGGNVLVMRLAEWKRLALEAKREQRCETCSHWIDRGESQYCRTLATIVPMRVYGQPFGCTAHTPKEAK